MPRDYPVQCWSCLGEFDAGGAVWCTCSARTPTKLCPFCFHCFCQADIEYQDTFWNNAADDLKEERNMLKVAGDPLGEKLIRSNLLNTDQLVSALKWQQTHAGPLGEALVDLGLVTRENIDLVAQGRGPESTAIDLGQQIVDASLITLLTVALCHRKRLLPISREEIGGKAILTLAMAGPTDVETIDQIQTLTQCTVIPMSTGADAILRRLQELFPEEVAAIESGADAGTVALTAGPGHDAPGRDAPSPAAAPRPRAAGADAARAGARRKTRPRSAAVAAAAIEPDPAPAVPRPRAAPASPDPLAIDDDAPAPEPEPLAAADLLPSADELLPPADDLLPPAPEAGEATGSGSIKTSAAQAAAGADATLALQKVLGEAIGKRASAVSFEVRGGGASIFFRIDGMLFRARPPAGVDAAALAGAVAGLASLPAGDAPGCGRITVRAADRKIDFVVRRLQGPGGASLLMKKVDPAHFVRDLDAIGLSGQDLRRLRGVLDLEQGLVVLSGPPHNGVESTRVALMAAMAREGRRVSSVEAQALLPVEGVRIEEIPFPPSPAALRAAATRLQGTEVLFLPEIQDAAQAALAIDQATGCLVVASIQARRASQVPGALLWHRLDPARLAESLRLVICQRLVRKVCAGCRGPVTVADKVLKMMGLTGDEALDLKVSQGAGCDRCNALSPGYVGRFALFEVLEAVPEIAELIGRSAPAGEIEREARRAGMSPLRAACLAGIGAGVTTLEEFQKGNF